MSFPIIVHRRQSRVFVGHIDRRSLDEPSRHDASIRGTIVYRRKFGGLLCGIFVAVIGNQKGSQFTKRRSFGQLVQHGIFVAHITNGRANVRIGKFL